VPPAFALLLSAGFPTLVCLPALHVCLLHHHAGLRVAFMHSATSVRGSFCDAFRFTVLCITGSGWLWTVHVPRGSQADPARVLPVLNTLTDPHVVSGPHARDSYALLPFLRGARGYLGCFVGHFHYTHTGPADPHGWVGLVEVDSLIPQAGVVFHTRTVGCCLADGWCSRTDGRMVNIPGCCGSTTTRFGSGCAGLGWLCWLRLVCVTQLRYCPHRFASCYPHAPLLLLFLQG
jgi:hypothetical protein